MAGLFGALGDSVRALTAHSRTIETTGRNLANVNNPNYARQRVNLGDRGSVQTEIGAQSLGLEARSLQQMRDILLDRQVVREIALKSSYEAQQSGYQKGQAALGQSLDRAGETNATGTAGSGSGISETMTAFFNSFASLAARPTDPGQRQSLFQNANILTDRIRTTDSRLTQVQSDLTSQVTSDLADANSLLQNIADLNADIGRFEIAVPGGAVDLRDQRQAKLEELAKKINVESQPDPVEPAEIQVFVRDGSGTPVILVNKAAVTGPLTVTGAVIKGGASATTLAATSGSIFGSITARDGGVKTLRDNLDLLAKQLVTSVNAAYNPTSATGDFFTAANITAANISVAGSVTALNIKASDGGAPGDNTIAQAVANLTDTTFSTGGGNSINGTFAQHYSATVSSFGQSLASANQHVTDQTNVSNLVRDQRDSVSGVSLDEEMTNMMKFQRAFQASSRVVQVINELLENVVNLGRV